MENQTAVPGDGGRYPTELDRKMRTTPYLILGLALCAGCFQSQPAPPVFVPPLGTVEIFATSAAAGPNTKAATDPKTGTAIHLISPPIITNADIAGVARSDMEVETIGGTQPSTTIPSLEVKLNATGTPKMLNATTNPASPTIAVVVNGTLLAAPNIVTPIDGSFRVTGDHTDPAFINAISLATGQSN